MEIRLDRIAKSFDKRRVIQPTTLTIRNGSFTTLLRPFRLRKDDASRDDRRFGNTGRG